MPPITPHEKCQAEQTEDGVIVAKGKGHLTVSNSKDDDVTPDRMNSWKVLETPSIQMSRHSRTFISPSCTPVCPSVRLPVSYCSCSLRLSADDFSKVFRLFLALHSDRCRMLSSDTRVVAVCGQMAAAAAAILDISTIEDIPCLSLSNDNDRFPIELGSGGICPSVSRPVEFPEVSNLLAFRRHSTNPTHLVIPSFSVVD